MNSNTILKPYDGLNIPFTQDGYLNATVTAAHFGKRPIDWLRLPDTKEYVTRLCDFLTLVESDLIITNRGGNQRADTRNSGNGGTWLHRKLAVPFARWCDVQFAIWCDHQIELILSGASQVSPSLPMVRDLKIRDLAYCVRVFSLSRDLWSKQMMLYAIKRLCGELSLTLPPAHLLGKPAEQHQLEI